MRTGEVEDRLLDTEMETFPPVGAGKKVIILEPKNTEAVTLSLKGRVSRMGYGKRAAYVIAAAAAVLLFPLTIPIGIAFCLLATLKILINESVVS